MNKAAVSGAAVLNIESVRRGQPNRRVLDNFSVNVSKPGITCLSLQAPIAHRTAIELTPRW
jgi:hypothetical protein